MSSRPLRWCLGLALIASVASAMTTPMGGAVALPRGARLRLPFPSGSRIRLLSGYSPSGGSSLHEGTNRASYANDYYALDLVYDGVANSGLGRPVVASFAGTVVRAGWASSGWANYGQRVILRHDLGDGHVYHTIYCHLNRITVTEGARVAEGQQIGELGRSCMGALTCSSFGTPHLHWAMHQDSTIGGSGTGGSYGGRAVVPESLDGVENLRQGTVITSSNGGGSGPACGDGRCDTGETEASCAADCRRCAAIPAAGRIVDESEACFTRGGNPSYWYAASAGYAGALLWTHATSASAPDNHGVWSLTFERAGDYLIEAYTAAGYNASRRAAYTVAHAGRTERAVVDQSAANGWNPVGRYAFAAGAGQSVRLDDNTGEAFSDRLRLAFDAVRVTPMGPGPIDAGTPRDAALVVDVGTPRDAALAVDVGTPRDVTVVDAPRPGADLGTDLGVDSWSPPADVALAAPDVGNDRDAGAADADDLISIEDGSGCACQVGYGARSRSGGALSLLALALVAAREGARRRRSERGLRSVRGRVGQPGGS
ncbi:MAG: peptidoglycan DD-metalloendopeptidase family protein [Deltaproteobacteria bacterium]|nr:peptidoglycan DD-metalloendopeptidase family protein [Deltaproteobacteria bacterium]